MTSRDTVGIRVDDVQLFDLRTDPDEMHDLALEPDKNRATILRMNGLLNDLMAKEVGVNDGRFLTQVIKPTVSLDVISLVASS